MLAVETKTSFQNPEVSLEAWLSEIEARWQTIPEFQVDPEKLRHLAIICDGNRRAAQERGLNPYLGHRAGVEVIKRTARACREWCIRTLTFWIWSTDLKTLEDFIQGRFNPEIFKTAPQAILGFLDTANQVLPDLVIRTGVQKGEIPHTSGFMPLQTAYSGWIFLPDLFPNLTPQTLLKPIQEFLEYERRFGR